MSFITALSEQWCCGNSVPASACCGQPWSPPHIGELSRSGSLRRCSLPSPDGSSSSRTRSRSRAVWTPSGIEIPSPICSSPPSSDPRLSQSASYCSSCRRQTFISIRNMFKRSWLFQDRMVFLISRLRRSWAYRSSTYLEATMIVVMRSRCTFLELIRKPGLAWQNRSMYTYATT